jgi:hypothetical protein
MDTWAGLFRRVEEIDPLERRARTERAEFEAWAAGAERRLISDLVWVAKDKARETKSATGVSVAVSVVTSALSLTSFGGAHGLVSIAFSGSSVDLYVTRSEGRSPSVHLACQRAPTSSRYPVILTLPGYLAIRADASGYRLLDLPERSPVGLDAVVLRAFTTLFGTFESVSAMRALGVATVGGFDSALHPRPEAIG